MDAINMELSKLVEDVSKMIEQDKQAVIIRAEGMLAGVALLAQAIEQARAKEKQEELELPK